MSVMWSKVRHRSRVPGWSGGDPGVHRGAGAPFFKIHNNIFNIFKYKVDMGIMAHYQLWRTTDILWSTDQNSAILVPIDSSQWDELIGAKIIELWLMDHKILPLK